MIKFSPIYVSMPVNTFMWCALATFFPNAFFAFYAAKV